MHNKSCLVMLFSELEEMERPCPEFARPKAFITHQPLCEHGENVWQKSVALSPPLQQQQPLPSWCMSESGGRGKTSHHQHHKQNKMSLHSITLVSKRYVGASAKIWEERVGFEETCCILLNISAHSLTEYSHREVTGCESSHPSLIKQRNGNISGQ